VDNLWISLERGWVVDNLWITPGVCVRESSLGLSH
jgi:hypothetical protein